MPTSGPAARGWLVTTEDAADGDGSLATNVSTRNAMAAVSTAAMPAGVERRGDRHRDTMRASPCDCREMDAVTSLLSFRLCQAQADQIRLCAVPTYEVREPRDRVLIFLVRTGELHPQIAMRGRCEHGAPGVQQSQPAIAIAGRGAYGFLQLPQLGAGTSRKKLH